MEWWVTPVVTSLVFITLALIGNKWTIRIVGTLVIICLLFTAIGLALYYPILGVLGLLALCGYIYERLFR